MGSNTVHLLIVDAYYGAAPVPAHSQKIALRLAEHMKHGRIDEEATRALSSFVEESLIVAEDMGAARIEAFATSAIRLPNSLRMSRSFMLPVTSCPPCIVVRSAVT